MRLTGGVGGVIGDGGVRGRDDVHLAGDGGGRSANDGGVCGRDCAHASDSAHDATGGPSNLGVDGTCKDGEGGAGPVALLF